MKIKSYLSANLKNQKVVLRVDYNVPIQKNKVSDATRIVESLPTIKTLLANNCSIVIIAHLGRPEGKANPEFTLAPVAKKLSSLLHRKVIFNTAPIDQKLADYCQSLKGGQIVLLENIRFYPGEEKNDSKLAEKLGKLGSIYIDDAFGCAHRAHASIHAITQYLPSYAGALLEKEVAKLGLLFEHLQGPVTFLVGGAKMDTKINLIRSFAGRVDHFIFGGGIANTFLAGQKYELANSLVQKDMISTATEISTEIYRHRKNIHLPGDFVIASKPGNFVMTKNFSGKKIPNGLAIYDIGKYSGRQFAQIIKKSKTIIWNGPMGMIEYKPFRSGTKAVAKAIVEASKGGAISILGGGDTIEAIKTLGFKAAQFTHVSTGGGAMLEFLENGTLPGIDVLLAK